MLAGIIAATLLLPVSSMCCRCLPSAPAAALWPHPDFNLVVPVTLNPRSESALTSQTSYQEDEVALSRTPQPLPRREEEPSSASVDVLSAAFDASMTSINRLMAIKGEVERAIEREKLQLARLVSRAVGGTRWLWAKPPRCSISNAGQKTMKSVTSSMLVLPLDEAS